MPQKTLTSENDALRDSNRRVVGATTPEGEILNRHQLLSFRVLAHG